MKTDVSAPEIPSPETIDRYIAGFPPAVQDILEEIRTIIRTAAPTAQETIKYRMPTFTLNGNLVHFAAFKRHIGLYPMPDGIEQFQGELSTYKNARGSVQFPLDQPMPFDLIRRIVKFGLRESLRKSARKRQRRDD
jgi:uncharacterized protein YdhG (YjbR/CyaY superfamily)